MALPPLSEDILQPRALGSRWLHKKRWVDVLRLLLALTLAFFITQLKLDYFESFLYDMRVRLRPAPESSGHVVLVMIDEATIKDLKGPLEAKHYAQLLRQIQTARPQAIVFDLSFEKLLGAESDKENFAKASRAADNVFVLTEDLSVSGLEEINHDFPAPLNQLRLYPGLKSADISNFAKDGVSRRMMLAYQNKEMLHLHLAKKINPDLATKTSIRGLFDFLDSDQLYIAFHPQNTYPRLGVSKILSGDFHSEFIKDKIVLIGQDLGQSELVTSGFDKAKMESGYVRTPYSREALAMTSTELHANMFDTLILNQAPARAPFLINFLFVAAISIVTLYVVFTLRPLTGLFVLAGSFAVYGVMAYLAFWPFGFWISLAHPWLAIFLCYYFFIPYRLIIENRRSWEIYQKHKLLKQVEELKSNFISMMSHDLKTPIARILGMTDMILRDENSLSHQQREAVDTIKHSGDDLLKFINSILNFGRIESQSVQLHTQARDINQLLDEVILKHDFLARLKKIQVVKEFEPLFPISVDPDLMKQVFSNLIENAIKYSPEDTKILVSTEEENGRIVIQVADQGAGISSEDLPNIFMKFYRSQNAKSSSIKGSGLGLYLAKYFVELHNGEIFVESTYGQGTTFTVQLPLG